MHTILAMNTIVSLQHPPLHFPNPSSWHPKTLVTPTMSTTWKSPRAKTRSFDTDIDTGTADGYSAQLVPVSKTSRSRAEVRDFGAGTGDDGGDTIPPPPMSKTSGSPRAEARGFGAGTSGGGGGVSRPPPPTIPTNRTLQRQPTNRKNSGDNDDDDEIPPVVFDRMLVRILFYVGAPMTTGIASLLVLDILKNKNLWDVPIWVMGLSAFIAFGASTLGLAYGTLSTSWDPDREGSFLGVEQLEKNWVELWKEEDSKR